MSPVHRALNELDVVRNNPEKVEKVKSCLIELINRRARLNLTDKDGCFPLDLAAKYGFTDLVVKIFNAGGDLHHCSGSGWTPLHYAAAGGHAQTVEKLLQLGAKYSSTSSVSVTQTSSNLSLASLNLTIDPHLVPSPLFLAIQNCHFDVFQLLVKIEGTLGEEDSRGRTALHIAALYGALKILAHLLEMAPHLLSKQDKGGNTPLHLAKTPEIASALFSRNLDLLTCQNALG